MSNYIETLAVAKVIKDAAAKAARNEVSPGKYSVDFTAHITGTVTVGDDYEQRIVAKAQPWDLLAVALSKLNGVTVESLVREALEGGVDIEQVKAQAEAAMQAIKEPTKTSCKGKVITSLKADIERVSTLPEVA